jgi:hypothetical protein
VRLGLLLLQEIFEVHGEARTEVLKVAQVCAAAAASASAAVNLMWPDEVLALIYLLHVMCFLVRSVVVRLFLSQVLKSGCWQ